MSEIAHAEILVEGHVLRELVEFRCNLCGSIVVVDRQAIHPLDHQTEVASCTRCKETVVLVVLH